MNCRLTLNPLFYSLVFALMGIAVGCSPKSSIKSGREAFEAKQYAKAALLLEKEYQTTKKRNSKAFLAYLAGQSYMKIKDPLRARRWFQKAYKKGYGDQALVQYAQALIRQEHYAEALEILQNLQRGSTYRYAFDRLIVQVKRAKLNKAQYIDTLYQITSLPVNTEHNEYGTVWLEDRYYLFTSDRPSEMNKEIYAWTGHPYMKIFLAEKERQDAELWLPQLQDRLNDGTPTLGPEQNILLFTSCYFEAGTEDATCKIMESRKREGVWQEPHPLPFTDERYNYTTPFWSSEDNQLYFSSDMPDGIGGYDLYVTSLDGLSWATPKSLGTKINSPKDELFPSTYRDTLYYSSEGWGGMGGMDIFKVFKKSNGHWSTPKNLGYPFNSGGDDIGALYDTNTVGRVAFYLSSTRSGGYGGFDLYHIEKKRAPTPSITPPLPNRPTRLYLAIKTLTDTPRLQPLPMVNIEMGGRSFQSDRKGQFITQISDDTSQTLLFTKQGYFTQSRRFIPKDSSYNPEEPTHTYQMRVIMKSIVKEREIVLKDIHYDFDKWEVRPDAHPTLDSLYHLLLLNPSLHIQLAAHTDCRGNEEYNMALSRKRAQSVMQYLIQKGISPTRLTAEGYGESQPLIPCRCEECTEPQRQLNRRTSFKVTRS